MKKCEKIRNKITKQEQISEALILNVILAFSGGFQDAYTYIIRNEVFANAQTGNIVLMSTYFLERQWKRGVNYLLPLLAFMLGVLVTENIKLYWKNARRIHWRQGILILECLLLVSVGFIPENYSMAANILVSFSCAMQVQAFRSVAGNAYASTMCIGNLRSGTAALSTYFHTKDKKFRKKAFYYFIVILFFAIGSGFGGNVSKYIGIRSIWISCLVLALCFALMELDREI